MVAVHGPDGDSIEYGYDSFSRIIIGTAGANVCKLEYNSTGKLARESCGRRSVEYSYGPTGQRVGLTPSGGVPVKFNIAYSGALTAITAAGNTIAEYRRDARGRIAEVQFGNGLVERRALGAVGQIRSQELAGNAGVSLTRWEYEYDAGLRPVERRGNGQSSRFRYTGLGWVESVRIKGRGEALSLRYDDHGNLLEFPDGSTARYGEGDRLLFDGRYSYEYDALGRVSARVTETGDRTVFHYDFRDLLIQVDHDAGTSTKYEYDAFSRRVLKVENSRRTGYQWDGNQLLTTWDDESPSSVTQFVMDPFRWVPVAQLEVRAGNGPGQIDPVYCHTDYIGAVTELTSAEGTLLWSGRV